MLGKRLIATELGPLESKDDIAVEAQRAKLRLIVEVAQEVWG